jgi:hypothetical protein
LLTPNLRQSTDGGVPVNAHVNSPRHRSMDIVVARVRDGEWSRGEEGTVTSPPKRVFSDF